MYLFWSACEVEEFQQGSHLYELREKLKSDFTLNDNHDFGRLMQYNRIFKTVAKFYGLIELWACACYSFYQFCGNRLKSSSSYEKK